ncbi:MAG: proline--tRNA ligase [Deltaproteobacteria bacterium]|nr:proline--tRNA ligase [Candidatus Tharpella aukensis]
MRFSRMHLPTLKEVPAEAEVISHRLMLRAGMIRRLAAGIYSYLPLGLLALRNVEEIIRQEMNRAGAQEVLLPAVQPAELWQESGRWDFYGKELLRIKDRHQRDYCFGPTHEEVITDLIRHEVRSYRQLPLNLYQIQTKFRDEIRPRFGLMRGREFIMKDAYSFDVDDAAAGLSYQSMREAYSRIFSRCGLNFRAVEADSGAIGGNFSHEFVVLAESGEDAIASCTDCDYAANIEKAESRFVDSATPSPEPTAAAPVEVATPDCESIKEVADFFGVAPEATIKSMIFESDLGFCMVVVPGDCEVNEIKVTAALGAEWLEIPPPARIADELGLPVGYLGPLNLSIPLLVDRQVPQMGEIICGANRAGFHLQGVLWGRDFKSQQMADLVLVRAGDLCPRCGSLLQIDRGIEVGHIFKLGTKYSEKLKATFLDQEGQEKNLVMGCYGIGVGRTVAAAIEQNYDDNGICFPYAIAPFKVALLNLDLKSEEVTAYCETLYKELQSRGISVIYDDRNERPGVKFKDADLIGVPLRLTLGRKGYKRGILEVKSRNSSVNEELPLDDRAPLWRLLDELAANDSRIPSQ